MLTHIGFLNDMKTAGKIILEALFLFALTFVLSLGHIVIANVYVVPFLAFYCVIVYCLCVWFSHRACGIHRIRYGFFATILVCIATFTLTECALHKDEKGCQDWVIRIIDVIRQTGHKKNGWVAE